MVVQTSTAPGEHLPTPHVVDPSLGAESVATPESIGVPTSAGSPGSTTFPPHAATATNAIERHARQALMERGVPRRVRLSREGS